MSNQPPQVTVGQFFETARNSTQLKLISGHDYMDNVILEEAINRPGLALAEFYHYFANKRIQVFGLAEDEVCLTSKPTRFVEML